MSDDWRIWPKSQSPATVGPFTVEADGIDYSQAAPVPRLSHAYCDTCGGCLTCGYCACSNERNRTVLPFTTEEDRRATQPNA